jgi:hypothetical protein
LRRYNNRHYDARFVKMNEEALFKMNRRQLHSNDSQHKILKIKVTNEWWVHPTLINHTAQKSVH